MICQYTKDKLINNYLEFFDNGFMKKKVVYNEGMKMGIEKIYYDNGALNSITNYYNNKKIGTRYIYNKKGILQFTQAFLTTHDLVFITKYTKNKIVIQGHFYKNKLHGLIKYYKNNNRYSYNYSYGELNLLLIIKMIILKKKFILKWYKMDIIIME